MAGGLNPHLVTLKVADVASWLQGPSKTCGSFAEGLISISLSQAMRGFHIPILLLAVGLP